LLNELEDLRISGGDYFWGKRFQKTRGISLENHSQNDLEIEKNPFKRFDKKSSEKWGNFDKKFSGK
jgi:hypothetical protein